MIDLPKDGAKMKIKKLIFGFCLIGLTVVICLAQNLHNVAGNGTNGNSGNGGIATNAQLAAQGVALDALGNMYIADEYASVIRRVDAITQIITTVAGTGIAGYNGDSIQANQAQLNLPLNVCLDTSGNLYISDSQNNRVRKIIAQGGKITSASIITTVAGDGTYALGSSTAGDGGPAINAQLNHPVGIVVDTAGNLYIGDIGNHALRKVDTAGIISTIAGDPHHALVGSSGDNGQAQFALLFGPHGIALDTAGNLYFADSGNHRVRKIIATGGQITKTCIIKAFAGPVNGTLNGFSGDGGLAVNARLNLPMGVAVDSGGNVYISDRYNARIRKVDVSGIITTIAGTGSFTPQLFGKWSCAESCKLSTLSTGC